MHKTIQNLNNIESLIKSKLLNLEKINECPKIIAVSKTFKLDDIMPLIKNGHIDFGENKVQEAIEKWTDIKNENKKIKLHLIGKLQTNKVKLALKIFNFIHSVDNEKLAEKISEEQKKYEEKPKIFIQINIGEEIQKSGVNKKNLLKFYDYCKSLKLDIVGIMCLPPIDKEPTQFFSEMYYLKKKLGLKELSMGMSSDYLKALEHGASYLRIGSSIFGERN